MKRISSKELAEWQAYERFAGPLDSTWQDEATAAIHEQFQRLNRLTGAAHFTNKKHRKNPVPKETRYPRPHELVPYEEKYDGEDDEDYEDSCECAACLEARKE